MSARRAALSLGSNLGDRLGLLQGAVDALADADGVTVVAVSPVVETEPVGGPQQPDYLNAVVVVETTLTPEQLLDLARGVERSAGRVREVRWGARTLDVDLLAVGDLMRDTDDLRLPHPRAHERAFVLVPWSQVDPDFVVAGRGTVSELLAVVGSAGVRVTDMRLAVSP